MPGDGEPLSHGVTERHARAGEAAILCLQRHWRSTDESDIKHEKDMIEYNINFLKKHLEEELIKSPVGDQRVKRQEVGGTELNAAS